MEYDVVIVGAGPAGLSTAIKLKQLDPNLNVCILEKGSEVGAHILSGNVFETKALDELIPNWKNEGAPVKTKVSKEKFLFLENWFSRESEEEMRIRLTAEMEEASVDNMGSTWAMMEMEHLEAKHSEE